MTPPKSAPKITRVAPAPTGLFHLGTARTAYINYLAARASGGKFILRIDDTDTARNKKEYTQVILDSLEWLGLEYDEIYYQSDRYEIYSKVARELLQEGKAFEATNGAIILKGPVALPNSFLDTIAGEIPITDTNREQIQDKTVLMRGYSTNPDGTIKDASKLGQPTYQFCSVVDDYYMSITDIIRGVDHITNTPKQIGILGAIERTIIYSEQYYYGENSSDIRFTHMGLIFKDKKKLSKRDGAASLLWYKEQGYSPEAMLNWMLLLGWGLKVPRREEDCLGGYTRKELEKLASGKIDKALAIELFDMGTLKNTPCNFSLDKLNSIQKLHS